MLSHAGAVRLRAFPGQMTDDWRQQIPPTYAEISPSGAGVKFIARATGDYGRKTKQGELYSSKRFFTITGNVLPGHETITNCQEAVEAFAASLGAPKGVTEGSAGNGSRAELVKDISESEWEAGRQMLRNGEIHRNLARVRAAAKEETQLALVLRGDYAAFHQKWPFVGIYRADGSLDESQVRAVVASGIKGRGFEFPIYASVMTHLFGAAALAKWGTKQAWREELAALWFKSPEPKHPYTPKKRDVKYPRGRAGNHAELLDKVYTLLQDYRAGAQAIVKASDIATALGVHRRTIVTALEELREAGRIATKRLAGGRGLVVEFLKRDVIYSETEVAELPAETPQTQAATPTAEETRDQANCVSSDRAGGDHISLADALTDLLDTLPRWRPDEETGERKRWLVTDKRVLSALAERYPERWADTWHHAAPVVLRRIRRERRNAQFDAIRNLEGDALDKKITSLDRTIRRDEKRRDAACDPTIAAHWQAEIDRRQAYMKLHTKERAKRNEREARRIEQHGYSLVDQADMLALVERARGKRVQIPPRRKLDTPSAPPSAQPPAPTLFDLVPDDSAHIRAEQRPAPGTRESLIGFLKNRLATGASP